MVVLLVVLLVEEVGHGPAMHTPLKITCPVGELGTTNVLEGDTVPFKSADMPL